MSASRQLCLRICCPHILLRPHPPSQHLPTRFYPPDPMGWSPQIQIQPHFCLSRALENVGTPHPTSGAPQGETAPLNLNSPAANPPQSDSFLLEKWGILQLRLQRDGIGRIFFRVCPARGQRRSVGNAGPSLRSAAFGNGPGSANYQGKVQRSCRRVRAGQGWLQD